MMNRLICVTAVVTAAMFFISGTTLAYELPKDSSRAKYFYIFGPDGDPLLGKEDSLQELYIYVPQAEEDDLSIAIYDPDTGSFRDLRVDAGDPWNTICEYSVYGADGKLLNSEKFGESKWYDRHYYEFGPYSKYQGEKSGDYYVFKLVAKALEGNDANLFRVRIYPYTAEALAYDITIRLLEPKGSKMYFYPQVPAGARFLTVGNYDMDPNGGTSELYDPYVGMRYRINDSESGKWITTEVPLAAGDSRRLVYTITKKTQKYAHAGLAIRDDTGNPVPLYFRRSGVKYAAAAPAKPKAELKPVAVEPVKPIKKAAAMLCNEFTFDATSSYDPDNQEISFRWDFGDGTTSTEPVVTHVYQKAGEYRVTLTVKDSSGLACDTATETRVVKVNMPPKPEFSFMSKPCVNQAVVFDASATKDDPGDVLTYVWNFGDGSKDEGQKVTKEYAKGGTYTVTLSVDDNAQTKCSVVSIQKSITVNTQPVADAGKDIDTSVAAGQELLVNFDGSRSKDADGDVLTYKWDFGDGSTLEGAKVTHVYKKGGLYTAKLTVNDGSGSRCSAGTDSISVKLNTQPVADAGPNLVCCVGEESIFDGSGSYDADADNLTYKWDFGDGSTAEGIKVKHVYTKRGNYTVTLRVDDNNATPYSVATDSFNVTVNDRPVAVIKIQQ